MARPSESSGHVKSWKRLIRVQFSQLVLETVYKWYRLTGYFIQFIPNVHNYFGEKVFSRSRSVKQAGREASQCRVTVIQPR